MGLSLKTDVSHREWKDGLVVVGFLNFFCGVGRIWNGLGMEGWMN